MNVGTRIAGAIEAAGHDVVRVALTSPTAEDPEVLAHAVREQRILVTHDRDFSELVFMHVAELPPGIIYIRYRAREVDAVVDRLIPALDFAQLKNHMTVIDAQRIRRTPFPTKSNDNG